MSVWLCSECSSDSHVYDSRPSPKGFIVRQRICTKCKYRWTTYEVMESAELREAINTINSYFPKPRIRRVQGGNSR